MASILAIDDEQEILTVIKLALEREGHEVRTVTDTKMVTEKMLQYSELLLLDVMMPDEDGFTYCQRIRQTVDIPIIFLTAKTSEKDLIHGLGAGADDYIQKPFTIAELRARVAAHLRRELRPHSHIIRLSDFTLNLTENRIMYNNNLLIFTKSQYAICAFLIEHAGQIFSKEQIFEAVFSYDKDSDSSVITEHIKNIRIKLKAEGVEPIETIWGVGYRWKREKL